MPLTLGRTDLDQAGQGSESERADGRIAPPFGLVTDSPQAHQQRAERVRALTGRSGGDEGGHQAGVELVGGNHRKAVQDAQDLPVLRLRLAGGGETGQELRPGTGSRGRAWRAGSAGCRIGGQSWVGSFRVSYDTNGESRTRARRPGPGGDGERGWSVGAVGVAGVDPVRGLTPGVVLSPVRGGRFVRRRNVVATTGDRQQDPFVLGPWSLVLG